MSDIPDIIRTQIVNSDYDAFWKDAPELLDNRQPLPLLVISLPLTDDGQRQQLLKMLQACKIGEGEFNLLELDPNQKIAWHKIREKLAPRFILLLGTDIEQLGMSLQFMLHQINRFNDRCWIPTLTIPQLEQYPDIKKHLWNYGLKPAFVEKAYG